MKIIDLWFNITTYNVIRLFLSEYENDFDRFFWGEFNKFCEFNIDWSLMFQ